MAENNSDKRIELILVQMGLLSEEGLMSAVEEKRNSPEKGIIDILIDQESITEFDYIRALGIKYNLPLVNLAAQKINQSILRYVSEEFARENFVLPVHETSYVLHIATADPMDNSIFEQVGQISGKQISLLLATKEDIAAGIDKHYIQYNVNASMTDIEKEFGVVEEEIEDIFDFSGEEAENNSIVKAVSLILEQSFQMGASDIHIEPLENRVIVRVRVDGELTQTMSFAKNAFGHVMGRLKVLGGLDIAERRTPQDGRMTVILMGSKVNMRISTLPTIYGEKVVIRILGTSDEDDILKVEELEMQPHNYEKLISCLEMPNGVLFVTGPTGSGKSTTIYSALLRLAKPNVNIITVEDPVEKVINGINQVQVNQKAGLTFAAGLRSILRQDPDIIMIGEVRDNETAEIGSKAAITGHLVLATMHTNDAASAFMRLIDMGVEPYIVASSVVGVVAQRLVKRICKYCKEEYEPTEDELFGWKGELPNRVYRGRGCPMCNNSGYSGRRGIHEVIKITPELRKMIVAKLDSAVIKECLLEEGFRDLGDNAQTLVVEGVTTIDEMKKIKKSNE